MHYLSRNPLEAGLSFRLAKSISTKVTLGISRNPLEAGLSFRLRIGFGVKVNGEEYVAIPSKRGCLSDIDVDRLTPSGVAMVAIPSKRGCLSDPRKKWLHSGSVSGGRNPLEAGLSFRQSKQMAGGWS